MSAGDRLLEKRVMDEYNKKMFGKVRKAVGMVKPKEEEVKKKNI